MFVGFLDDRKVQRAIRAAGSDAVVAYLAVILGAARDEDGATFADELPLYLEDRADELLAVLVRVGLLTPDGRIAEQAFDRWVGSAIARAQAERSRKAAYRERARRGRDVAETSSRRTGAEAGKGVRRVPVLSSSPLVRGEDRTEGPTARELPVDEVGTVPAFDLPDDDPLGPLPPATPAQERRSAPETTRKAPEPAPAVLGRPGPPCRSSAELFRRHQSEHVIRGAELVACHACDRELADRRSFRERIGSVAGIASP